MIVMSLCKGLLLIAFCELFPTNVWQATTELNLFFKDLTSTTITVADMEILERYIPIIICKLERIFPLGFFDSMEHLPIHLPYEARIASLYNIVGCIILKGKTSNLN